MTALAGISFGKGIESGMGAFLELLLLPALRSFRVEAPIGRPTPSETETHLTAEYPLVLMRKPMMSHSAFPSGLGSQSEAGGINRGRNPRGEWYLVTAGRRQLTRVKWLRVRTIGVRFPQAPCGLTGAGCR